MKILAFLFVVFSQAWVSSQADIGDKHLTVCAENHQHANELSMSLNQDHTCEKCINAAFATPNETMRYFVLINQVFIETEFKYLYLSKVFSVENPPPIFS